MTRITFEQLPPQLADMIVKAQGERVVITRDGQPYALIVGLENKDAEDLELEFSPSFWRMIEDRRRSNESVPLRAAIAELEEAERGAPETSVTPP